MLRDWSVWQRMGVMETGAGTKGGVKKTGFRHGGWGEEELVQVEVDVADT